MNLRTLKENLFSNFSHIYVEENVINHEITRKILERFANSKVIKIKHYKDIFCRSNQDVSTQRKSKKLIIAQKQNNLIYKGAPVCQDFGNEHFYYTSCIMNCIYNCDYCYLQGMYSSADIVIFVNLEDVFKEVEMILQEHPVYLCVSYDTDIAALEEIVGYTSRWIEFAKKYQDSLKIEIRTKSAHIKLWEKLQTTDNVILAYTLSPKYIIDNYEHHTPSIKQRVESIKTAMASGYKVRLCFDPVIYSKNFDEIYGEFLDYILENVDMKNIQDISLGTFRVSQDYMKKMRKINPDSAVVNYPYVNTGGVYHYPDEIMKKITEFFMDRLEGVVNKDRIFTWD